MQHIECELNNLCIEFIKILDLLRNENIINENEYFEYAKDKLYFLETKKIEV